MPMTVGYIGNHYTVVYGERVWTFEDFSVAKSFVDSFIFAVTPQGAVN